MKHIPFIIAFATTTLLRVGAPTAKADDNPYAALSEVKPPKAVIKAPIASTILTFAVNVNGRIRSYSDSETEDVAVLLPLTSPWRCVRRRVLLPANGLTTGSFVCSADHEERTEVIVSTSCGIPGEAHNSATLAYGGNFITLKIDCVTVEPMGF